MSQARADWQLPCGVSRGTWDYVANPSIALDYDSFHGANPLMQLDQKLIIERLARFNAAETIVADFGCGTARIADTLIPLGFRVLNVDLSTHMLRVAQDKRAAAANAGFVHSNLVELDWIKTASIDVGLCLFSSIGMIRSQANRRRFLGHVRRALRKGGFFFVHVHNRHQSWMDPTGPWWLMSTWWKSLTTKSCEFGDRIYTYRGLPRMFLHIYSRRELIADLRAAGFETINILPIKHDGSEVLEHRPVLESLRVGGYFAHCPT